VKPRIRPLEQDDLHAVAAVYELVMRSGSPEPPPGLVPYFERTLLAHPWVDSEIPSLVYEESDGDISGFIGSHVRRFELDGKPIRVAYGGQLVAHPRVRHKAVGALLMRHYLAGRQDATVTDTASEPTHAMWGKLGGETVGLGCIEWTRVFRPGRFAAERIRARGRRGLAASGLRGLDAVTTRIPGLAAAPAPTDVRAEELTPERLVEAVDACSAGLVLRPAYDEPFLGWLFGELEAVSEYGSVVRKLLRTTDGSIIGWYVYYLRPGGTSHVLQVMALERSVGTTLDYLFHEVHSNGAAALRGRVEPRLLEPLARRRCILRYSGGFLVHSQDSTLLNAVAYGKALITRMDGEWWMGHHTERFSGTAGRRGSEQPSPA
jgi:hypothetical protein